MTAQAPLSEALSQIVAPVLRRHGFKGSGKSWRRRNELGNLAISKVQSSTSSTLERLDASPEEQTWWGIRTHADAETAAVDMVQNSN